MKLLLDTHALIWWWADSPRLSPAARAAVVDAGNQVLVSAASAWEIAIKQRLGKLSGVPTEAGAFAERLTASGFESLPIRAAHALHAGSHPADHRDPFDRMLAAQTEIEGAVLVTLDPAFGQFGCKVLW